MAIPAFLVLLFGAGLPFTARLRHAPLQRAALTPFAGMLVLFLSGAALHLLRAPVAVWQIFALLPLLGCWLGRREIRTWFRDPTARTAILHWLWFAGWLLACLALIRNTSGGDWTNDWLGHYQRTQHILYQVSGDAHFFAADPFPSRPPLLNVIAAFVLGTVGDSFSHFQIAMTLLGSLAFWPAMLLLEELAPAPRRQAAQRWLLVLLMASPAVMQNGTFPWTKLGTAAWILLAAVLTWRGVRRHQALDLQLAAGAGAAALVSHYSAAVYILVALPLLAWAARDRATRQTLRRALPLGGAIMLLVVGTWLAWAIGRFGVSATFGSNSTVTFATNGHPAAAFASNLTRTLVPEPFLSPPSSVPPAPTATLAYQRDLAFHFYQSTLTGMIGLCGCVLLLRHGTRLLPRARGKTPLFVALTAVILLGIASHTAAAPWGVAHICLLTLPLAFAAAAALLLSTLGRAGRMVLIGGLVVDVSAGIGLQLLLENAHIPPQVLLYQDGMPFREAYGQTMWLNAAMKLQAGVEFWGDRIGPLHVPVALCAVLLFVAALRQALKPSDL